MNKLQKQALKNVQNTEIILKEDDKGGAIYKFIRKSERDNHEKIKTALQQTKRSVER